VLRVVDAGVPADAALDPASTSAGATSAGADAARGERDDRIGGGVWSGFVAVVRSPYLLGICLFLLLHTVTGTFAYFQQTEILGAELADRAARTAFLAHVDLAVNVLTAPALRLLGVGLTLGLLPVACALGFGALGAAPSLAVLAGFQITRRAANFALSRPARELLYTVVSREDKYKAKNLIDTFVYRGGDQLAAWSYAGLAALGLAAGGLAATAVALSGGWLALSLWLGRRQRALTVQPPHGPTPG
jgi:AAA family ATP:ADP antiporter